MKNTFDFIRNEKICITGGSGFIGSNLIRTINNISKNSNILNLDLLAPTDPKQKNYWKKCDLNNKKDLIEVICDFNPKYIVHLAADATMLGGNLDLDFKTNIKGVKNLISAIQFLPKNTSLIVASSQHVKKPGSFISESKNHYKPLGLYGKSKLITESIIKNANLSNNWFIVRPTLIWGPGNIVMADNIFKYIYKDIYYHPKIDNTVRAYGYIDNTCMQILKLLDLDGKSLKNRIFYLADGNILQKEWVSLANKFMDKGELKTVSNLILNPLSIFGDYVRKIYPKFPIYRERYLNLTTSNPVPLHKTFFYLGMPKFGLNEAMLITTDWIKSYYEDK